jgi:hypothetical protein
LRAPRPAARDDARAMGQWVHGGGFSVDGSGGASRPLTVPGVSACCATAPAHPSPWTGYANSIPNACSMRAPSPVRAGATRCSSPPRPSSSTSASAGDHDRRRSSLRDAGLARAGSRDAQPPTTPAYAGHPHTRQKQPLPDPHPPHLPVGPVASTRVTTIRLRLAG